LKVSFEKIRKSYPKELRAWSQLFIVNPLADIFIWIVLNLTKFTPNQISTIGFIFIFASAFFFLNGNILIGSIFFVMRWIADTMDGRLARLQKNSSYFGSFWDNYPGVVGVTLCGIAFTYHQYQISQNIIWFLYAYFFLFLKYLHTWESMKFQLIIGSAAISPKKSKKQPQGIFNKIQYYLVKFRFDEPLNQGDVDILLFVIFPTASIFIGYLFVMWTILLIILGLKALVWLYFYATLLNKNDEIKNKN